MNHHSKMPYSYQSASRILHRRRVQRLQIHDDLALAFVTGGVAVLYRDMEIVRWSEDGRSVSLCASRDPRGATPLVVAYIALFLPCGYCVRHRAGRMTLHEPVGASVTANELVVVLPAAFGTDLFSAE